MRSTEESALITKAARTHERKQPINSPQAKAKLRNSLAERKESCLFSPGHSGAALTGGRLALLQSTGGEKIEESFETFATFGGELENAHAGTHRLDVSIRCRPIEFDGRCKVHFGD